ncbi:MAG: GNAT family N-acetyltransferase [Hyphomicrobiaceae bacterium]
MPEMVDYRSVRTAELADLPALLMLYRHLNPEMPSLPPGEAERIWQETLARPGMTVLVAPVGEELAAACTLITAPNLLRGGAPHAFIETVVTHTGHRRQGYGQAVVAAALAKAWALGCYQVMLLTTHTNPTAHTFYRACGFTADHKAGFVIRRPD